MPKVISSSKNNNKNINNIKNNIQIGIINDNTFGMNRTQYNANGNRNKKRGNSNNSINNNWINNSKNNKLNTETSAYANVIRHTDYFSSNKDKSSFLSTKRGFPFDQSSGVKKSDKKTKNILPTIDK